MNNQRWIWMVVAAMLLGIYSQDVFAQASRLLNEPVDISSDFRSFENTYFLADSLQGFNPEKKEGEIRWIRNRYFKRMAFNNFMAGLGQHDGNVFPGTEYATHPVLPFSIEFVSPRTVRIQVSTGYDVPDEEESLMLDKQPPFSSDAWEMSRIDNGYKYESEYGSVIIREKPWRIEFRDAEGNLLTETNHRSDNTNTFRPVVPFSYVRRADDYSRSVSATFRLSQGEKIYGFGESFTEFDKRGQKVVLWMDDANGVLSDEMYKPIPFFMSNRGYGMFMHTSTPVTADVGKSFQGTNQLMIGDDELDLFVFMGEPKDILDEYTDLTGKSPLPPLWSFGYWQSRITYFSEKEVRDVAKKLRKNEIPADVLHLDTGWFETDWRNNYQFSDSRFSNPKDMVQDLKKDGFHISLWQLPYFTPKNSLFDEIIEKDLYVRDREGDLPYEDAVLDFSNPDAVDWYQEKIGDLLDMGVGAIKVDFGEAAPHKGYYASGRTGFYEHNLYPLRYNKAAADITYEKNNEHIIWARSAWAGSQRYPIHWGGDAANSNNGMAASLRGGLSMGVSGFAFWSHDFGGFVEKAPEELYRRWTLFGFLTSHSRAHGVPPTEPWEYSENFLDMFRKADNMRYRLMPYIYAQAKESSETGLPMMRALFIEYPDDPGSWLVDDVYLFGSDMLVAPIFQSGAESRDVYLPPGKWVDYQTGATYGGGWHHIKTGELPIIMLVKSGTVLPHIGLAQSTADMDWSELDLVVYGDGEQSAGNVYLPESEELHEVRVNRADGSLNLDSDPLDGEVEWKIYSPDEYKPR